jgi:hypothetical protein
MNKVSRWLYAAAALLFASAVAWDLEEQYQEKRATWEEVTTEPKTEPVVKSA